MIKPPQPPPKQWQRAARSLLEYAVYNLKTSTGAHARKTLIDTWKLSPDMLDFDQVGFWPGSTEKPSLWGIDSPDSFAIPPGIAIPFRADTIDGYRAIWRVEIFDTETGSVFALPRSKPALYLAEWLGEDVLFVTRTALEASLIFHRLAFMAGATTLDSILACADIPFWRRRWSETKLVIATGEPEDVPALRPCFDQDARVIHNRPGGFPTVARFVASGGIQRNWLMSILEVTKLINSIDLSEQVYSEEEIEA